MSVSTVSPGRALAPLTPRGVAAYAYASFGRMLLVQTIVSLLAAATVVWFLTAHWFPIVREVIRQLPGGGELRHRQLEWRGPAQMRLAESKFLALAVNLEDHAAVGGVADVQVELRKTRIQCCSMLGCLAVDYPNGWIIAVDRNNLEPWWGAWEMPILAGVVIVAVLALLSSWALLATLYCPVIYFVGYLSDRDLTGGGSWRLAGAGLMPGALFLTLGILIYGLQGIGLVQLGIVFLLHLVIGWVYIFVAPLFLRRGVEALSTGKNPFTATPQPPADSHPPPPAG